MSESKKIASLGEAPATFDRAIQFNDIDGSIMEVDIKFNYMTSTQHGQLIDQMAAAVDVENEAKAAKEKATKEKAEAPEIEKVTAESIYRERLEKDAGYLLKIISGWGINNPPNKANLITFIDRYPAAMRAIGAGFYSAIHEGHAGN